MHDVTNFVIFGECLIELSWDQSGQIQQGFAGDVYSVSVYLKRCNPATRVSLLCAIGTDPMSEALATALDAECVDTNLLLLHPDRHLGLYSIHNSEDGERSFTYWRAESAARQTLGLLAESPYQLTENTPDCFYLSGISLAISENREALWPLLADLKARGSRVVFDTNYRPKLWPDASTARECFDTVLTLSDLVLPGVEDMALLYGLDKPRDIGAYLQQLGVEQMVLKDGAADILYGAPGSPLRFPISPVETVVDTTAAGDAFSGTLLGELSKGAKMEDAIAAAAAVSARVIQYRGAILPAGA